MAEGRNPFLRGRRIHLSSQLSLALQSTDYGQLEKCYSIWICRDDIPLAARYGISFYEIVNTKNVGGAPVEKEIYDLMTLVVIRLGDKELWEEAPKMDGLGECIYRDGFKEGIEQGVKRGTADIVCRYIQHLTENRLSQEDILENLATCLGLEKTQAKQYLDSFLALQNG